MSEPRPGDRTEGLILIVSPGGVRERGGMGRIVGNLTGFWDRSGTGPRYRVIDPYGPRVLLLAPLYLATAMARMIWLFFVDRVRLVHIHMASRGSVVRKGLILLLAKALGAPVILHFHAGDFADFYGRLPAFAQRLLLRLIRMADLSIVLGQTWRDLLVGDLGIDPARVAVLANAVPRPPEDPRPHGSGPTCRLLFLGRLEAQKGVPELIEALADPRLRDLPWQASLVGGGEVARFRAEIDRRGLAERIECPGWQDAPAVARRLAEADVFVLPSHHEGLSMALLEALAAGLAIVATPVGAIPEVIEDRVSGLLVPVGDPAALAAALVEVTARPDRRAELAAGGSRCFNEKFEISAYCAELEALYEGLMSDRDGPCGRLRQTPSGPRERRHI